MPSDLLLVLGIVALVLLLIAGFIFIAAICLVALISGTGSDFDLDLFEEDEFEHKKPEREKRK
jgi:hypothetical protein